MQIVTFLSNGDFDANPDGWALTDLVKHQGSVGVYNSSALVFQSGGDAEASVTGMNQISVSDVKELKLRFTGKGKGRIGIQFQFFDAAGNVVADNILNSHPLTEQFARFAKATAVPANATSCRVALMKLPHAGPGNSIIDDVELIGK